MAFEPSPDYYRKQARMCRDFAAKMRDPEIRGRMLKTADAYEEMAALSENQPRRGERG